MQTIKFYLATYMEWIMDATTIIKLKSIMLITRNQIKNHILQEFIYTKRTEIEKSTEINKWLLRIGFRLKTNYKLI